MRSTLADHLERWSASSTTIHPHGRCRRLPRAGSRPGSRGGGRHERAQLDLVPRNRQRVDLTPRLAKAGAHAALEVMSAWVAGSVRAISSRGVPRLR